MKVLLLGCDGNAGKNYAKSLKMDLGESITIYGTGMNRYQLFNAGCTGLFQDVFHLENDDDKLEKIIDFIYEYNIDFIHAQPEEEVEFLCQNHAVLKRLTNGKREVERRFYKDKFAVQRHMGLETAILSEDLHDTFQFEKCLEYGGGKVWVRANNGSGSRYALPVTSLTDALNWSEYLINMGKIESPSDLTIAPYLPGREYAVQIFMINGELFHMQQRERVEHFFAKQMVSGQSSTPSVAKTTSNLDVYDYALQVVEDVSEHLDLFPDGIYSVDIRYDIYDQPQVTEVNYGRYFTTVDFFSTMGMNTPVAELFWATKREIPEKMIGTLRNDIHWTRGLDYAPEWYNGHLLKDCVFELGTY